MVRRIHFIDECFYLLFYGGVYSQCKLCITVEIPQVLFFCAYVLLLYNDWCRVVTVLITVTVPQLQYFDQVDDVPVVHVVVGVSSSWTRLLICPFLCMSCSSAENCEGFAVAVFLRGRCPCCAGRRRGVQLLDMVIDMPVLVHVVFVVLKTVEIRSCSISTRWSMSLLLQFIDRVDVPVLMQRRCLFDSGGPQIQFTGRVVGLLGAWL